MKKYIYKKKYKEYLNRNNDKVSDLVRRKAFYEPRHTTIELNMKSGKVGIFKLITWLPYQEKDEPYDVPKKTDWMFVGYKGENRYTSFSSFLKERKKWEKNGDLL